jgi:hypothetical protein
VLPDAAPAIATRAEVLAVCTNTMRGASVVGTKKVSELYSLTSAPDGAQTLVSNAKAIAELPMSAIKEMSHDEAGDLKIKYADPMVAARVLLDDHNRAKELSDPMERPRIVMNTILFGGSERDKADLRRLALRIAQLAPEGGGNGDGG